MEQREMLLPWLLCRGMFVGTLLSDQILKTRSVAEFQIKNESCARQS